MSGARDVDARHKAGHDARGNAMHDIRFIREHPDAFDRGLARRGLAPQANRLTSLDQLRRSAVQELQSALTRRAAASAQIGAAKKRNDHETVGKLTAEMVQLKTAIPLLEGAAKQSTNELEKALAEIANLPLDEVPDGGGSEDNVEHHRFGAKRSYISTRQHFEIGEALGQMDFETAARLSGARFVVLKKGLARLERALGQFMLNVHTSEPHNYMEISPPILVRDEVMFGTAQLPKFVDDQFKTENIAWDKIDEFYKWASEEILKKEREIDGLDSEHDEIDASESAYELAMKKLREGEFSERRWLIPTAEVPLTNLVRESILDEAQLPLRYTACTPCFRAEAGAAGKDTRGMIRQHQFTKVELVSITTPEQSKDEHERMLACAEEVLKRLDLHYRVMTLCTGDMGFASQKTYDIEVWLPGQNAYREISSCSVCGDFQARRMNARYRTKEGRQVRHVHTLNGSGVAVGRALIAVMETYQQEDGSIAVPEALAPYMGGMKKIEKQ
jgi:seryl-tRNA synthetase